MREMYSKGCTRIWLIVLVSLIPLVSLVFPVGAAETAAETVKETVFGIDRDLWSSFWRVVNFLILAFLLYRFLKDPVTQFFRKQHEDIVSEFESLEKLEEDLVSREARQKELLDRLDEKIAEIKSYYEQVGQEEKERLLRQAEEFRKKALADAELAAQREFEEAKKQFREEVVEKAVQLAEERIKQKIEMEDQQNLILQYLQMLESSKNK